MKARIPDGYLVLFYETDLESNSPLNLAQVDSLQRKWLAQLNGDEQVRILQGCPARIVQLMDGGFLCEFNMQNVAPDKAALRALAQTLYPSILEFYKNPANGAEFEQWLKDRVK